MPGNAQDPRELLLDPNPRQVFEEAQPSGQVYADHAFAACECVESILAVAGQSDDQLQDTVDSTPAPLAACAFLLRSAHGSEGAADDASTLSLSRLPQCQHVTAKRSEHSGPQDHTPKLEEL
eukprot:6825820-Prymnesium_polylepis.1